VGNAVVDDVDISTCGRIVATVSAVKKSVQQTTQTQKTVLMQKVGFWDADSGEEKAVLPCLPGSGDAFKVRSLRFLNVGSKQNAYFVAAYNQKVQSKQCETYLAIWGFDKTKNSFHLKQKQKAGNEIISTLSVCPSGDYIAVGTSAGSVAMFDTHTLQRIYIAAETHKNFVTAVEFLPQRTLDIAGETLPGVCSEAMCSVVSVSVDNEIQIHRALFPEETAFSTQLLRIALHCLILYFLGWLLFK
jgi:WD40 repeat protein